ncbi:MAG: hypothetical protein NZ954_07635 [Thermofilaceae archaeon]|nr:hypothetical protein [Thermofilaceae archaeon]MCX8179968.1 hypothetical protein [Thermofilaceae archaeon]
MESSKLTVNGFLIFCVILSYLFLLLSFSLITYAQTETSLDYSRVVNLLNNVKSSEYRISNSEGEEVRVAYQILGEETVMGEESWKVKWSFRSIGEEVTVNLWISKSTGRTLQLEMNGELLSGEAAESIGLQVLNIWFGWIEQQSEVFKMEEAGKWLELTSQGRLLYLGSELRALGPSQLLVHKWRWEGYPTADEEYRGIVDIWIATTAYRDMLVKLHLEQYEPPSWFDIELLSIELVKPQPLPNIIVNAKAGKTTLKPGEKTVVEITYANKGDALGVLNLTIFVDGEARKSWLLTPRPGEAGTLNYTVSFDIEGSHRVSVGGRTITFTVSSKAQPPTFKLSNLSIKPSSVKTGERVDISLQAANTGGERGSYEVTLTVNGLSVEKRTITLDPGETITVTFSYTPESSGTYVIEVNGLSGTLTVVDTGEPGLREGVQFIYVAAAAVAALIFSALILWRRKRTKLPPPPLPPAN